MCSGFEDMRDKFIARGKREAAAKKKAARIWREKHPDEEVDGYYERKNRKRRRNRA